MVVVDADFRMFGFTRRRLSVSRKGKEGSVARRRLLAVGSRGGRLKERGKGPWEERSYRTYEEER